MTAPTIRKTRQAAGVKGKTYFPPAFIFRLKTPSSANCLWCINEKQLADKRGTDPQKTIYIMYKCLFWPVRRSLGWSFALSLSSPRPSRTIHSIFFSGIRGDYCLFGAFIYLRFRIASHRIDVKSSWLLPRSRSNAPGGMEAKWNESNPLEWLGLVWFGLKWPNPGGYFGGKFELWSNWISIWIQWIANVADKHTLGWGK